MSIQLIISGCCGRMGQTIARLVLQDSVFSLGAALEARGHAELGRDYGLALSHPADLGVKVIDDAQTALSHGDVLIEFTTPDVTTTHAQLAQQFKKPMVIGTTGFSDAQLETIRLASNTIPVVVSPNMSLGVNVLFELARTAAQRLGPDYAAEALAKSFPTTFIVARLN